MVPFTDLACSSFFNRVAHELAALGCNLPSGGVQTTWDAVPHELEALVSSEAAVTIE